MTLSKKELNELRKKNPDINIPDENLKIDSFNNLLKKSYDSDLKTYKEIKKELGLKDADIAEMFGYKNVLSYRNAKDGKKRLERGIELLYSVIKNK